MPRVKDPYIDENGVLKNLLGIKNERELEKREKLISFCAYDEILTGKYTIDNPCSPDGIKEIHRHLFKDIYPWAGQFRKMDIVKDNSSFLDRFLLEQELEYFLLGLSEHRESIVQPEVLAKEYGVLNYIHPFREGNGRTQHIFWSLMLKEQGKELDFMKLAYQNRENFLNAVEAANYPNLELKALTKLFETAMRDLPVQEKTEVKGFIIQM